MKLQGANKHAHAGTNVKIDMSTGVNTTIDMSMNIYTSAHVSTNTNTCHAIAAPRNLKTDFIEPCLGCDFRCAAILPGGPVPATRSCD